MPAPAQPIRWFARPPAAAATPELALPQGALELLILQPSSFCNLDCAYCYLPDRANRSRMSMATLAATLHKLARSPLPGRQLSIVWHAGEPMAVPIDWYETAFALVREHLPRSMSRTTSRPMPCASTPTGATSSGGTQSASASASTGPPSCTTASGARATAAARTRRS